MPNVWWGFGEWLWVWACVQTMCWVPPLPDYSLVQSQEQGHRVGDGSFRGNQARSWERLWAYHSMKWFFKQLDLVFPRLEEGRHSTLKMTVRTVNYQARLLRFMHFVILALFRYDLKWNMGKLCPLSWVGLASSGLFIPSNPLGSLRAHQRAASLNTSWIFSAEDPCLPWDRKRRKPGDHTGDARRQGRTVHSRLWHKFSAVSSLRV